MKDASDNDSVGASISAETTNATEIAAQIPTVTAAPDITVPLVTVTDEPALVSNTDKKKSKKKSYK